MKHGDELGFGDPPQYRFDDDGQPVLITGAALPYEEQHRQRVRKYLSLMAFRIPALILAAVAYSVWENGLISLAIVAASIPLPWMAVLIANDRPPRRAEEPRRFDHRDAPSLFSAAPRPSLPAGVDAVPQPEPGEWTAGAKDESA